MGKFNPSGPGRVQTTNSQAISTPSITGKVIALKDIEESITLGAAVKFFRIRTTNRADIRAYYTTGASDKFTIKGGSWYTPPALYSRTTDLVLYLTVSKDSTTLEIETWV